MGTLHTVNKSPFEKPSLQSCITHALPGSVILLIEDAVYAARSNDTMKQLFDALQGVRVCALGPDLMARGIREDALEAHIEVVDYSGFVALAAECDKVESWL